MTNMTMPQHRNPCPWSHEINKFGRGFHSHHIFTFNLSETYIEVEKKIFKDLHQFYSFYPQIKAP